MPSRNSAFHFDNATVIDADTRVKVGSPSVEMRREVIIEVQNDQNAVDDGNNWHASYELRTRRTASCQPA